MLILSFSMIYSEFKGYTALWSSDIYLWKVCFTDEAERQLTVFYMITDQYIRFSPRVTKFLPQPEEYPVHGNHWPALEHNTKTFLENLIREQKNLVEKYFAENSFRSKELLVWFALEQAGYDRARNSLMQKYPNIALIGHSGMGQDEEVKVLGKIW